MSAAKRIHPALLLLGAIALGGVFFVCAGAGTFGLLWVRNNNREIVEDQASRTWTREQFEAVVRSANTQEEIVSKVGRPSTTHPAERGTGERWFYDDRRVKDPASGRMDERVIVRFDKSGKVERVEFIPSLIRLR